MDFRPFVHSKLHLEHFPGKGRGFKAISDIKVGTLLIEEEPVAISIGSINKLAMRLLRHPQVMNELYYPPNYPQLRSQLPPYTDDEWSRAVAQAASNAFSNNNKYYVLGHNASFFNHSCAPNATLWMTENFILRFYAIAPIAAGDEVCIAYGRLYCPREYRQEWLKSEFGFLCQCPRCLNPTHYNDELITKICDLPREKSQREEAIRIMRESFDSLQLMTEENDNSPNSSESALQSPQNSLKNLLYIQRLEEFIRCPFGVKYSNSKLHVANWRLLFVRAELISRCLIAEEFEKALFYALQQMAAESLIYPQFHPLKLPMYQTFLKHKDKIDEHRLLELVRKVEYTIDWKTYETIDSIFCPK